MCESVRDSSRDSPPLFADHPDFGHRLRGKARPARRYGAHIPSQSTFDVADFLVLEAAYHYAGKYTDRLDKLPLCVWSGFLSPPCKNLLCHPKPASASG